ncbi:LLM class flavin-dependent oxidoreductase [Streptomyces sp. NPDC005355]|uniref:LLM class flavin-dependent oxidoreductase n=1 Tax=Streptomyces sp. NPDC005355 TaxID=3157038 RepID=UPI0033A3E72B
MKLSLVELATVTPGSDKPQALNDALHAAQQAEELGYHRIWYAEHHNTPGFAAQDPAILIALALSCRPLMSYGPVMACGCCV